MPVIAKFCGIVIRLLIHQTFGTHVHVFYKDSELVIGFNPLRVIQGDAPMWVRDWALGWIRQHQREILFGRKNDRDLANLNMPLSGRSSPASIRIDSFVRCCVRDVAE